MENLVDQIGTDHPFDTITELIEEVLGIDFSSDDFETTDDLTRTFFNRFLLKNSPLSKTKDV